MRGSQYTCCYYNQDVRKNPSYGATVSSWLKKGALLPPFLPTVVAPTQRISLPRSWNETNGGKNTLRQRLARFVRLTLSFSKSVVMHEACLLLFLHRYHLNNVRKKSKFQGESTSTRICVAPTCK